MVVRAARDGRVLDGLRDWLCVCVECPPSQFVTVPSFAVAEAWTALLATPVWDEVLALAPAGVRAHPAVSTPLPGERRLDGLVRTWTIACRRERIDDTRPDRLPRLFAVDRDLRVPDGAVWGLVAGTPPFTRVAGPEPTTVCAVAPSDDPDVLLGPWGGSGGRREA